MDTLTDLIEKVDDDYLIGLSNKGTLKRAYKDLEQENPVLTSQGEDAQVAAQIAAQVAAQIALKEETCVLRVPLGESSCSCPSQSICRHIITAILWMKKKAESGGEKGDTEKTELLELPKERMIRACGSRHLSVFLAHIRQGALPPIEESSIVTVKLPWENAVVKLLEPFAYSTCSCHSKELCTHKAQAVLAYQIEKGKLTLDELDVGRETENSWDENLIKQACGNVCEELCDQICTGLSRQSPEVSESLERLAVITHRAGLPVLESGLREAAAYYQQYFLRSAAFACETLFKKILILYRKAQDLMRAENQEEIRALAGTFRDTYEPVGRLHLMGMGGRSFKSKTGYEGEIYYFLETGQKKWYTWTDARPVFYEGTRRRPPAGSENAAAPWGLNCSREQMQKLEFDLQNAKAASGGRLSVSQETKGEITGAGSIDSEEVSSMIVWDYEMLLKSCFGREEGEFDTESETEDQTEGTNRTTGRRERLALVGAVRWGETSFDTVSQRFSWSMYDETGRKLYISLKYTKEERLTISLLERLEQRLRKRTQESIVFFGSLYMDEERRLCLYPIEFFFKEEDPIENPPKTKEHADADKTVSAEILRTMDQYVRESAKQLSDLFVSGLYSVQEETISQLSVVSEEGERLGLHRAGAEFACIAGLLKEKRHRMEFSPEPVIHALANLSDYIGACLEKLSYDTARLAMNDTEEADKK
ncbi:MAG: hypothetical protein HDR15_14920 [Lachnospiraceae bacterium]|nr:hypothetical protein [Lachnospiraceae bacterium]